MPDTITPTTEAGADDAVLDFLARRVEAIALSVAAWTPQTSVCDEAHFDITNSADRLREVIGLTRQRLGGV